MRLSSEQVNVIRPLVTSGQT